MNQFMASYAAVAGAGLPGGPMRDEICAVAAVLGLACLVFGINYFRRALRSGKIGPLRFERDED